MKIIILKLNIKINNYKNYKKNKRNETGDEGLPHKESAHVWAFFF